MRISDWSSDVCSSALGGALLGGQLRDRVDGVAAGDAHLDGPEVLEVAGHSGLRGGDALGSQQLHQVGLARDGLLSQEADDPVLSLRLRQRHQDGPPLDGSSSRNRRIPRKAWRRLWACVNTTLWSPSTTAAVTSSPRWAGRQCMNTASGAAAVITSSSTLKPSKAWRRASASAWIGSASCRARGCRAV